jgi:hypothetical protein
VTATGQRNDPQVPTRCLLGGPWVLLRVCLAAYRGHGVQAVPFGVGHDVLNLAGFLADQRHQVVGNDQVRVRVVRVRLLGARTTKWCSSSS